MPFQEPSGGPNFFPFDDTSATRSTSTTTGDGRTDVTLRLPVQDAGQVRQEWACSPFLYNDGPITRPTDANWLVPQTYNVDRTTRRRRRSATTSARPANVGPRDAELRSAGRQRGHAVGDSTVFAGQRDDPFFVDLGSIFDLAACDRSTPSTPSRSTGPASTASAASTPTSICRSSSSMTEIRRTPRRRSSACGRRQPAQASDHQLQRPVTSSGPWHQVSRLGNPLINEVIIPRPEGLLEQPEPDQDAQFAKFYLAPEVTAVANVLYRPSKPRPRPGRPRRRPAQRASPA